MSKLSAYFAPFMVGKPNGCIHEVTLSYFEANVDCSLPMISEIARVAVSPSLIDHRQRYAFVDCAFTLAQIRDNDVAVRYLKMPGFFALQAFKVQMLWTMKESAYLKDNGVVEFGERFGVNPKKKYEFGDTTRTQSAIENRYELLFCKAPIADKSSKPKPIKNGMPTWYNKDHGAANGYANKTRPTKNELKTWREKVADVPGPDIVGTKCVISRATSTIGEDL